MSAPRYVRKSYQFTLEATAESRIQALLDTYLEAGHGQVPKSIQSIGGHQIRWAKQFVDTPATYDENGDEVTPATYEAEYSVDVLWKVKEDTITYTEEGEVDTITPAVQDWTAWDAEEVEPFTKHVWI